MTDREGLSMSELFGKLRDEFLDDKEYAHAYMESAVDAYIATQIKVLREQHGWTQEELALETGMRQERISVLENVNYSSWSISTLRKLARAYDLVVRVSFESFSPEIKRIEEIEAGKLRRTSRAEDLNAVITGELNMSDAVAGTTAGSLEIGAVDANYTPVPGLPWVLLSIGGPIIRPHAAIEKTAGTPTSTRRMVHA